VHNRLWKGAGISACAGGTPGNYPKENILHIEHGESLKSGTVKCSLQYTYLGTNKMRSKTFMRHLTTGMRSEQCVVVRTSKGIFTQT